VDMGVNKGTADLLDNLDNGAVKGMFIFGEVVSGFDLSALELLVVQDTHLTETALTADVVLPGVSFVESEGTFTNAERRIQKLNQAIPALSGMENWEVIMAVANAFGASWEYCCPDCIREEISVTVQEYKGLPEELSGKEFWPVKGSPVLYGAGYAFDDGKARLKVVGEGPLFKKPVVTDHLENSFIDFLKEKKIV